MDLAFIHTTLLTFHSAMLMLAKLTHHRVEYAAVATIKTFTLKKYAAGNEPRNTRLTKLFFSCTTNIHTQTHTGSQASITRRARFAQP